MEFKPVLAKIVGTPNPRRDSWVFVEDSLFLVLELFETAKAEETPEEISAGISPSLAIANRGKEIISFLTETFNNLTEKNLATLEDLVRGIKTDEEIELSLILGVKTGKAFYVICRGGGTVIIKREEKTGEILEGEGSISGFLEPNDLFILATPRFREIVSFQETETILRLLKPASDQNPEPNRSVSSSLPTELAESLTPLVHKEEDTSGVAVLIVQFEKTENEEWVREAESEEKGALDIKSQGRMPSVKKIFSPIIQRLLALIGKPSTLYLRQPLSLEEKKKRVILGIAVILAILLGASIVLGIGKRSLSKKVSQFTQTYENVRQQYNEAKALVGVDNQKATVLLEEGKKSILKLKESFKENAKEKKDIDGLLVEIDKELGLARQVFKVNPEVFLEIGLIKEKGEGAKFVIAQDKLVVLDSINTSIYEISLGSKSSRILAGGEKFLGASLIGLSKEGIYVLTKEGVVEIKSKGQKVAIKKDSEWGEIKALNTFGSNLYLFDAGHSQVFKYVGAEAGFSSKREYLVDKHELSRFSSMAVDGSIWLAGEKILKFTQGRKDTFDIQGVDPSLGTDLLVFTSGETKDLFVLDRTNKRLVVLEKNGSYKAQYVWEGIGEISDMVVSEEGKLAFLLVKTKIYKIELKT